MSNNYNPLEPIIESFLQKYGMFQLLEDIDIKKLKRTSESQYLCCCPFHDDNTESFSVNVHSGLFTCFSCDAHGNLIEFVKLAYNLDFKEAKDFVMTRSGLSENTNIEDLLFNRDIFNLTKQEETIDEVINWPIISEDVIKRMYSKPDPYNYLQSRGFNQETINYFECGYTEDFRGKGYDKNHRITIPGHDEFGKVIGFVGRTPEKDVIPKYLYTAGYPKSHTLFNLHRAKKYSDVGLILVEGSIDCMRLKSLGYSNGCAILGSSLSKSQQDLLKKYTDKVYFAFDNDNAGLKANKNAITDMKDDLDVYYVSLEIDKKIKFNDIGDIQNKEDLDYLMSKAISWSEHIFKKGLEKYV